MIVSTAISWADHTWNPWLGCVKDACKETDIAFWHKQSSAFRPGQGVELDGELIHELPVPRQGTAPRRTGQAILF